MLRILNFLGAGLFAAAAIVQYNDPDPLRWICVYGSAAAACLAGNQRVRGLLSAGVGVAAAGWLLTTNLPAATGFLHMFDTWQMSSSGVEEAREAGGLLIVAMWMAAIAFRSMPRENADPALYVRRRSSWSA